MITGAKRNWLLVMVLNFILVILAIPNFFLIILTNLYVLITFNMFFILPKILLVFPSLPLTTLFLLNLHLLAVMLRILSRGPLYWREYMIVDFTILSCLLLVLHKRFLLILVNLNLVIHVFTIKLFLVTLLWLVMFPFQINHMTIVILLLFKILL